MAALRRGYALLVRPRFVPREKRRRHQPSRVMPTFACAARSCPASRALATPSQTQPTSGFESAITRDRPRSARWWPIAKPACLPPMRRDEHRLLRGPRPHPPWWSHPSPPRDCSCTHTCSAPGRFRIGWTGQRDPSRRGPEDAGHIESSRTLVRGPTRRAPLEVRDRRRLAGDLLRHGPARGQVRGRPGERSGRLPARQGRVGQGDRGARGVPLGRHRRGDHRLQPRRRPHARGPTAAIEETRGDDQRRARARAWARPGRRSTPRTAARRC